jgi:hypothetical protein
MEKVTVENPALPCGGIEGDDKFMRPKNNYGTEKSAL